MNRLKTITLTGSALLLAGLLFAFTGKPGKVKRDKEISLGFWNIENLFDLENDPKTNDEEFLPDGSYGWTQEHYDTKLKNLSRVISQIGDKNGPEILGLAEIENKKVVEALIGTELLAPLNYGIVHEESPDQRGIDVALIYKKDYFTPLTHKALRVNFPENQDIKTRDILLVRGLIHVGKKSDTLSFAVNHWPSRRGGSEESSWKRQRAATVLRTALDSLLQRNPNELFIAVGDFNDDPTDTSLLEVLGAKAPTEQPALVNLMNGMQEKKEMGTLMYRRKWNLFDQVIVTKALQNTSANIHMQAGSEDIFVREWMQVEEGDWKGAPKRSHIRRVFYPDGFSDHLPVYIKLEN